MLKKGRRILKNTDFIRIYRRGKKINGNILRLYIYSNNLNLTRFGYSISKKVGKAARRNLIKRRLREICRQNLPSSKPGYDVVIVARQSAVSSKYSELENEVLKLSSLGNILTKEESSDKRC